MRTSQTPFRPIGRRIVAVILLLSFLSSTLSLSAFAAGDAVPVTEEATRANVSAVDALAASLYRANSNSGRTTGKFTWDTESKSRSWTYYNGIMMDAFLMLDSDSYTSYVNSFYAANVAADGKVDSTGSSDNYYRTNELDSIPPTRALFDLLRASSGVSSAQKTKYRKMIDYVYSVMLKFDTISQAGGNFKHKMNNSNWATYQVALDGLYMAQPFFMEVANALDDGTLTSADFRTYSMVSPNSAAIYNDVCTRMLWIGNSLYDSGTGLYNHGWGPSAGVNGQYWLRAVGWYAAALADVISMLPDSCASQKNQLIQIERQLFDGMMNYQDEATGMWYNVINYDSSLKNGSKQNLLESSGSALMAYAMLKAYNEGDVGDRYGAAGLRAFNGTVSNELKADGLHNVYRSSGVATTPEGYLTSTYELNEAKGVGPLMMAATCANQAADIHNHPEAVLSGGEEMTLPVGTAPDFSGVALQLNFSNGTSEVHNAGELVFGGYDVNQPGAQQVTVAYDGTEYATLPIVFAEEQTAPEFRSHSLLLSGQIGVNFYMDLSMLSDEEREGSYMEFNVNGKTATDPFDAKCTNPATGAYHGFTCYVNSIEMADTITATFHYGADKTIENTFSVQDYISYVTKNSSAFSEKVVTLVRAINDYGYHAQTAVDSAGHTQMAALYGDTGRLIPALDGYAMTTDLASDVAQATYSLSLSSETMINLYLTTDSQQVTATVSGGAVKHTLSKQSDGRWRIQITGINAAELGDTYTVTVTTAGGTSIITASALSYVQSVLGMETDDTITTELKYTAAALYDYYKATKAYVG